MHQIYILAEKIENELSKGLPGRRSQEKMMPGSDRVFAPSGEVKQAAVMLLLFPDSEGIHISFIQRAEYEGVHSGQISFPGGMYEEGDGNLVNTAFRETAEETGISPGDIQLLGKISPLYIPVSDFLVHPYISYLDYCPEFDPDPSEVQFMVNIPVSCLLDKKKSYKKEKRNLAGLEAEVPYYSYKDFKIWGATAMILSEFIDLVATVEPDLWDPGYSDSDYSGR